VAKSEIVRSPSSLSGGTIALSTNSLATIAATLRRFLRAAFTNAACEVIGTNENKPTKRKTDKQLSHSWFQQFEASE
jgi:hypothetical protein